MKIIEMIDVANELCEHEKAISRIQISVPVNKTTTKFIEFLHNVVNLIHPSRCKAKCLPEDL